MKYELPKKDFLGLYTLRGNGADRTQTRLQIFDGSFKTAYRVIEFNVFTEDPLSTGKDVVAVLNTEGEDGGSLPSIPFWDAQDNRQIAWGSHGVTATAEATRAWSLVDPDNLVVEDLYFTGICNTDGTPINYLIRLEKWRINDWEGALAMVRARSQNV